MIILQTTPLPPHTQQLLEAAFHVVRLPADPAEQEQALAQNGPLVHGIAGTGSGRVDAALLDRLPNLKIVSSFSAGLDEIDTVECARRGILIKNTSHVLAEDVADTALWLLMGVARRFGAASRYVQQGAWGKMQAPHGHSLKGLKVGILGLGHIGKALAHRLEGLGVEIAYHGRSPQPAKYAYHDSLISLSEWCNALVVCCPATPETNGIVDAAVMDALGSEGFIVNVARGTVIDEEALATALLHRSIFGAGLDVFAHEPDIPSAFLQDENVICLPHIGSATKETRIAMGKSMIESLVQVLT